MKIDKALKRDKKRDKRKNGHRVDNTSMKNVDMQRTTDIRKNRNLKNILNGEKDNG